MSDDAVATMHPEFPRWYRSVDLQENRDRLRRRWAGVKGLADDTSRSEINSMICTVFRCYRELSSDAISNIRKRFKDADEFFDMKNNDRELEILCASTLAVLLEQRTDLAAGAALALTTAHLSGARSLDLPFDLIGIAEDAIVAMSETHRTRPELNGEALRRVPKVSFDKAATQVQQRQDWEGARLAFIAAANEIAVVIERITKTCADALDKASEFISIQDEELQILWWLFGGRSHELDTPFREVTPGAQPLVFAKELADATQFLPGPKSVKALLSRTGLKDQDKTTIPDAVNACCPAFLERLADDVSISSVTQPIHCAIRRKLETNDEASWIAGWSSIVGVERDVELSALNLANLFYRERLLKLFAGE